MARVSASCEATVIEQLKRYMLGGLALNMTGVAGAIAAMEDEG